MERIASFSVDHLLLEPGVYVSRIDRDPATGAAVTTFDLRLTTPNKEPVMNTAECHTIVSAGRARTPSPSGRCGSMRRLSAVLS